MVAGSEKSPTQVDFIPAPIYVLLVFKIENMKRFIVALLLLVHVNCSAQFVIADIIKEGIRKVIVAVDLKIQKLQNKTIWLQNAQKSLENTLSKTKLAEISDWVEKQRKLYDDYFQELRTVKDAISYYHRVKDIIETQVAMLREYKQSWAVFRADKNFTRGELDYMFTVYSGMIEESLKSVDQLMLAVNAFAAQMSDAKRLEIIDSVADQIETGYMDLKEFNNQNKMLSLQRSFEKGEIDYVKKLYGL